MAIGQSRIRGSGANLGFCLFVASAAFFTGQTWAVGPAKMDPIIENVRANEELYNNIEVIYRREYSLNKELTKRRRNSLDTSDERFRYVLQNGLLYVNEAGKVAATDGRSHTPTTIVGYDGELS